MMLTLPEAHGISVLLVCDQKSPDPDDVLLAQMWLRDGDDSDVWLGHMSCTKVSTHMPTCHMQNFTVMLQKNLRPSVQVLFLPDIEAYEDWVDLVQNAMRAWSAVDNHPSLREYLWLHLELTFEAAVVHDCNDVFSNVLFWPRNLIQMVGRFHVLEKEATQLITMWFQQCICKIFDYWTLCFFRTGLDIIISSDNELELELTKFSFLRAFYLLVDSFSKLSHLWCLDLKCWIWSGWFFMCLI